MSQDGWTEHTRERAPPEGGSPPQMPGKDHALSQGPRERFLAQFSSQIYFYSPAAGLGCGCCTWLQNARATGAPQLEASLAGSCHSQGGCPPVRLQANGSLGQALAHHSSPRPISQQELVRASGILGAKLALFHPKAEGAGLAQSPTESWWLSRARTRPQTPVWALGLL